MASPWTPAQPAPQMERPWMGMALLVAVPLLALVLIRLLWSGSSLWFLTIGILLLGAAAVTFLARRQGLEQTRQTLAPEANRLPLVLLGLGVLFLGMLLLPNFASSSDSSPGTADSSVAVAPQDSGEFQSEVSGVSEAPGNTTTQDPQSPVTNPPASDTTTETGGTTHIVAEGDTLWDIATTYGVSVDAILAANGISDPESLQVGDEIIIPSGDAATSPAEE